MVSGASTMAPVSIRGAALVQQWCSNGAAVVVYVAALVQQLWFLVQLWCSSGGLWCSFGAAVVQQRWLPGAALVQQWWSLVQRWCSSGAAALAPWGLRWCSSGGLCRRYC